MAGSVADCGYKQCEVLRVEYAEQLEGRHLPPLYHGTMTPMPQAPHLIPEQRVLQLRPLADDAHRFLFNIVGVSGEVTRHQAHTQDRKKRWFWEDSFSSHNDVKCQSAG